MKRLVPLLLAAAQLGVASAIDLSGDYLLHLQSTGEVLIPEGETATDPSTLVFDDGMRLPGTTDLARKGPHVTDDRPFEYHLSREYDHVGPAYYKRRIVIPHGWSAGGTELFLERVMWQSRVWVDGKEVGEAQDSLNTPHIHSLGTLTPGEHDLVIRVDNRMVHPIGDKGHAYGAQTQSLWNGIVGRIELRRKPAIELVRTFPSLDGTVDLEITGDFDGRLTATVDGATASTASASSPTRIQLTVKDPVLWSEFSPHTYDLKVVLSDDEGRQVDSYTTTFGFRTVSNDGNQLLINGKPTFMRGNLECAVFPLTGHPPVSVDGWKEIWQVYKEHNLNHARFHSWCPPEAAFIAADQMGIYLQVEAPIWIDHWMTKPNPRKEMDTLGYPQGPGKGDRSIDDFAQAEIRRTIDAYGNHPSFVFFAIGNELGVSDFDVTGKWMGEAKTHDPRHLYAASTARTITPFCDFNATHSIPGIGWVRQHLEFGTDWDYEKNYSQAKVPIIAHEIGQWPVYVDWAKELPKYTGALKPYRLEDMAAEAERNGLAERAEELRAASGGINQLLYRDEIESFLRTPSCRGFQLLGMQDFSGQGEALVGWLDSFYDGKGSTRAADFRRYCAPTVPLLKLPGYVFKASDRPTIGALVHHYGPEDLNLLPVTWSLTGDAGRLIDEGRLERPRKIGANGVTALADFKPNFGGIKRATQATLTIEIGKEHCNSYQIWIYPAVAEPQDPSSVVVTSDWEHTARPALAKGKAVVLDASALGDKTTTKLAHWRPLYWSVPFFPGQNRETIGLLVDGEHPAFERFPTPDFGAWNWHRISNGARGFDLTGITDGDYRGIAEPVTDFHLNRRIGSIFELKVGVGRLLVCGYGISKQRASEFREVAQLRQSLLAYAAGPKFRPTQSIEVALLDELFENPALKLQELPEQFAEADLYVNAAGRLTRTGVSTPWDKGGDQILRLSEGLDYEVTAEGVWRDDQGSAWHGKSVTIMITPRAGVPGKLYVRLHDWNGKGRSGTLKFEDGPARSIGDHTKGIWVEFPVIREDTNDATLILKTEAATGPNLMITDIAFVPGE